MTESACETGLPVHSRILRRRSPKWQKGTAPKSRPSPVVCAVESLNLLGGTLGHLLEGFTEMASGLRQSSNPLVTSSNSLVNSSVKAISVADPAGLSPKVSPGFFKFRGLGWLYIDQWPRVVRRVDSRMVNGPSAFSQRVQVSVRSTFQVHVDSVYGYMDLWVGSEA